MTVADGDAQAVGTEGDVGAVADNDALPDEVAVDGSGIGDFGQKEVGVGGIDALAAGQQAEGLHEAVARLFNFDNVLIDPCDVTEGFEGFLGSQVVDVIGVFHTVHHGDDVGGGKGHAETDGCTAEGFGKGVENDEVRECSEVEAEGSVLAEVAVGLVNNDDAFELAEYLLYLTALHGVACGIVGGADEDEFGVCITGLEQGVGMHLEFGIERYGAIGDVIDVGTHFVHAVGGFEGYDVVETGLAEEAKEEVDGFVGTVAQEDIVGWHLLERCNGILHPLLQWVGIAVEGSVVGGFVGIEKHLCILALKLVAGTTVWAERTNVFAQKVLEGFHHLQMLFYSGSFSLLILVKSQEPSVGSPPPFGGS